MLYGILVFGNLKSLANMLIMNGYNIKMLTHDMGIFTEKGGTILFRLAKEGNIVVDTQFQDSSANCIEEIKKKAMPLFDLVINTHHHADHTSGNINFKGLAKRLLAHSNSKAQQECVAKEKQIEDKQWYPTQTFENMWSEDIGKETITVSHYGPGHTSGDSIVYFERAGIIHLGDLVFNRKHPFVDRTGGANIKNWINVLEQVENNYPDEATFICGHSGRGYDVVLAKKDVSAFKNYLSKLMESVAEQINAGRTKEEIVKTTSIPGAEEWKGEGIELPLTAAYEELSGK